MRDPWRHLLYDNYDDLEQEVRQWLLDSRRRSVETLGLGIDCSDSLLYEGFTGNARRLIPFFSNPTSNPKGCKLILLTKSTNIHYLTGLPTENIVVSLSLNPEPIADLWEGKYPDTFERMTPPVRDRLEAAKEAQDMGFEVRMRIDPILTPTGWEEEYQAFWSEIRALELRPSYITLGTYREKNPLLTTWASKWGLPAMEWQPNGMKKEGSHYRLADAWRREIYKTIMLQIQHELPGAWVGVCKETHSMRRSLALRSSTCNCLR